MIVDYDLEIREKKEYASTTEYLMIDDRVIPGKVALCYSTSVFMPSFPLIAIPMSRTLLLMKEWAHTRATRALCLKSNNGTIRDWNRARFADPDLDRTVCALASTH